MPDSVDDAYQVFVNGQQIGHFGRFTDRGVTAYGALPRAFSLPQNLPDGKMTIAIRLWMDSATPFNNPDAGGLHGPPILGFSNDVAGQIRLDFDDISHAVGSGFLESLILIMALFMAAALYFAGSGGGGLPLAGTRMPGHTAWKLPFCCCPVLPSAYGTQPKP